MQPDELNLKARTDRFTLLAFLAVVIMLFTGFTAAFIIRSRALDWRPVPLPPFLWVNTGLLLLSSGLLELARRGGRRCIGAAAVLGILFLIGQLYAWKLLADRGVFLSSNPHGSFFYTLTAVHGVHLAGGIFALAWALRRRAGVELCTLYWHFMGGIWVYILVLLSL